MRSSIGVSETLDFTGFAGLKIQIKFLFHLDLFREYTSGGVCYN